MGEIKPINRLKDKAPSMLPKIDQNTDTKVTLPARKWYQPNRTQVVSEVAIEVSPNSVNK